MTTAFVRERLTIQRANLKRSPMPAFRLRWGTDTGFFGVIAAVASQIELALMVEAGLSPEAALRAATMNAARMMGREKDFGSCEEGKFGPLPPAR